jgi:hypothetical protein
MIAYFVHDSQSHKDIIVVPDMGCSVAVDAGRFEDFISVNPDFGQWSGDACGTLSPEDFGTVVATRVATADVCVIHQDLWRERMFHYMSRSK